MKEREPKSWIIRQKGGRSVGPAAMLLRLNRALHIAYEYGQSPGESEKQWVIDQMVRALTGDTYPIWVRGYESPDGKDPIAEWDRGISPWGNRRPTPNAAEFKA